MALLRMLPCVFVFFTVMGFIMAGVATPTESAATGVLGAIVASLILSPVQLPHAAGLLHHGGDGDGSRSRHHVLGGDVQPGSLIHRRAGAIGDFVTHLALPAWLMFFALMRCRFILFMFPPSSPSCWC